MDSVIKYYVCLHLDALKLSVMSVISQFSIHVNSFMIRTLTNVRLVWTFFVNLGRFYLGTFYYKNSTPNVMLLYLRILVSLASPSHTSSVSLYK